MASMFAEVWFAKRHAPFEHLQANWLLNWHCVVCVGIFAGIRAAVEAGVPVFGITSGQEPAVLAAAGACALISDFHQLVQLAEQQAPAQRVVAADLQSKAVSGKANAAAVDSLEAIVVDSR